MGIFDRIFSSKVSVTDSSRRQIADDSNKGVWVDPKECCCACNFPKKWLYLFEKGYNESFRQKANKNLSSNELEELTYNLNGIACLDACPMGIITIIDGARYGEEGGIANIDPKKCTYCKACLEECIPKAIKFKE